MKFQENGSQRLELIPKKTSQIWSFMCGSLGTTSANRSIFETAGKFPPGTARRA